MTGSSFKKLWKLHNRNYYSKSKKWKHPLAPSLLQGIPYVFGSLVTFLQNLLKKILKQYFYNFCRRIKVLKFKKLMPLEFCFPEQPTSATTETPVLQEVKILSDHVMKDTQNKSLNDTVYIQVENTLWIVEIMSIKFNLQASDHWIYPIK